MNNQMKKMFFTSDELKKLYRHMKNNKKLNVRRDLLIFKLLELTGLRISTALSITLPQVDQGIADKKIVLITKGNRKHTQLLTAETIRVLKELVKIRAEYEKSKHVDHIPYEYRKLILSSHSSNGITPRTLQQSLKRYCKAAGISQELVLHSFRHTLAKRIITNHEGLQGVRVASLALGHSSPSITWKVYGKPSEDDVRDSLEKHAGG